MYWRPTTFIVRVDGHLGIMSTSSTKMYPRANYLLLLAVQIIGASFFVWEALPTFRQLMLSPGEQFPYLPYGKFATIGTLVVMQGAY